MAYQCVNASNQYFTFPALNVSVPPVTFSLWINTTAVIAKSTALFIWRGAVNAGLFLNYTAPHWELRYYIGGGTQWQTATGLYVSTGVWQHACAAIDSSQARLFLGGTKFTNNVSHATSNINEAGDLARDPLAGPGQTSYHGAVAEAAIWTAALTDGECLALSQRVAPPAIAGRLHDLVFYKDLVRDLNRGLGPALTAVNSPGVVPHPPQIYPQGRRKTRVSPARFVAPYRLRAATVEASHAIAGSAALRGAASGLTHSLGEVSS